MLVHNAFLWPILSGSRRMTLFTNDLPLVGILTDRSKARQVSSPPCQGGGKGVVLQY